MTPGKVHWYWHDNDIYGAMPAHHPFDAGGNDGMVDIASNAVANVSLEK